MRSRGTDHATIGKQTRTTNTLNVLYKTGGTRYTCAQRTKVLFAFITPHNMSKLTLTRSKLRPDSRIARQSTYSRRRSLRRQTYRTTNINARATTFNYAQNAQFAEILARHSQTDGLRTAKRTQKANLSALQTTPRKFEHVALSNYQTNAATAATPTNLATGKTRPLTTVGYYNRRTTTEHVSRQTYRF